MRTSITFPDDLWERAKRRAAREGLDAADVVRLALANYLAGELRLEDTRMLVGLRGDHEAILERLAAIERRLGIGELDVDDTAG